MTEKELLTALLQELHTTNAQLPVIQACLDGLQEIHRLLLESNQHLTRTAVAVNAQPEMSDPCPVCGANTNFVEVGLLSRSGTVRMNLWPCPIGRSRCAGQSLSPAEKAVLESAARLAQARQQESEVEPAFCVESGQPAHLAGMEVKT